MPPKKAPAKPPRVKGVSIYRPFGSSPAPPSSQNAPANHHHKLVLGYIAKPIDPSNPPPGINAEHTHQWSVYVRGVDGADLSYWLKKVQFKLHETYTNSLRTIETPPFEVTETGWGEFEVQIKLYFVPEANEKAQTLWHALKLHPYGPDAEGIRERREAVISQSYEEIVFNEPAEPFYEILTSGAPLVPQQGARGKGGKGAKQAAAIEKNGDRSAEIPYAESAENPYSQKTEGQEIDRMNEAIKKVEAMVKEERAKLVEREKVLMELRKSEGIPIKTK